MLFVQSVHELLHRSVLIFINLLFTAENDQLQKGRFHCRLLFGGNTLSRQVVPAATDQVRDRDFPQIIALLDFFENQ